MTQTTYENNNELVVRYQQGDDLAFTELFEQNEGLIRIITNKYNYIQIVDKEDILSACYMGFMKACKTFCTDNGRTFSSYCTFAMEREVFTVLEKMKRKDRDELARNSDSMNAMVEGKEGETERIHLIDAKQKTIYFEDDFEVTQKAIDYALLNNKCEFKWFLVPLLCEEYTQREVVNMFNVSKQVVNYQMKVFKKYFAEYMNNFKISQEELMS